MNRQGKEKSRKIVNRNNPMSHVPHIIYGKINYLDGESLKFNDLKTANLLDTNRHKLVINVRIITETTQKHNPQCNK